MEEVVPGSRLERKTVGIEASLEAAPEAWVALVVEGAEGYSILECMLDNKLWGNLQGMEVVAGPEEERAQQLEEEGALQLAEEEEEGHNNQPADIERGMGWLGLGTLEAFLPLGRW